MTLCNGVFSKETERKIVEDPHGGFSPHPCDTCAKSVFPENYEGVWMPSAHEANPTDWNALRENAAKLGISLSEFQQRQRESKARRTRKSKSANSKPTEM